MRFSVHLENNCPAIVFRFTLLLSKIDYLFMKQCYSVNKMSALVFITQTSSQ